MTTPRGDRAAGRDGAPRISFACGSCGRRLAAPAPMAGRTGRCHGCGHRMVIPASTAAEAGVDWRRAVAGQLPGAVKPAPVPPPAPVAEGMSLGPVTPAAVPRVESTDWLEGVGAEEEFVVTRPEAPARAVVTGPSELQRFYRSAFSLLVRASSRVSEASYTVSFLLLVLAIAAGIVGQHTVARVGVTAIVTFNLVGLLGDVVSLVTLSFRKSPLQGGLFLLPPCAAWFLWTDWTRYRETVGRMRIPLIMLGVVAAAYAFVPWLSGTAAIDGSVGGRVGRAVGALESAAGLPEQEAEHDAEAARGFAEAIADRVRSWFGGRQAGDAPAPRRTP